MMTPMELLNIRHLSRELTEAQAEMILCVPRGGHDAQEAKENHSKALELLCVAMLKFVKG